MPPIHTHIRDAPSEQCVRVLVDCINSESTRTERRTSSHTARTAALSCRMYASCSSCRAFALNLLALARNWSSCSSDATRSSANAARNASRSRVDARVGASKTLSSAVASASTAASTTAVFPREDARFGGARPAARTPGVGSADGSVLLRSDATTGADAAVDSDATATVAVAGACSSCWFEPLRASAAGRASAFSASVSCPRPRVTCQVRVRRQSQHTRQDSQPHHTARTSSAVS